MLILECTEAQEMCRNLEPFLNVVKVFLEILRWTVPILLIVLGTLDMFNAATKAEDEKILQDARKKLIKRIIYGIVVFLVPFIINIIMDLVVESGIKDENNITPTSWVSCWTGDINTKGCKDIYAPDPEPESNNTCNCKVCENGSNDCKYVEMATGECKSEGGTCQTSIVPSDKDDSQKCSSISCLGTAKIDSFTKSIEKVYYKNDCYCKVTIADPSIYNSSDCSDIVFSSGNYAFSFYENDGSMANINCYFKNSNNSGNSNKNDCTKPCSRKNLVLGRESDGNLNNNTCTYSAVLDIDANLDCTQSCKNT